jgi:hypothetical protein
LRITKEVRKGFYIPDKRMISALPNAGPSGTFLHTPGADAFIVASALMYGFRMRRRERRFK